MHRVPFLFHGRQRSHQRRHPGLAALGLQSLIGAGLSYSLAGLLGVLTAPPLAIWGTLAALEYVHYRSANDGT